MDDYKKTDLLVTISQLYYEHDYSQNMIAEKLELSRPYISKLLQEARDLGIVNITVSDPNQTESWLERELRQRFQLRKVFVAPPLAESKTLAAIGAMCARYLSSIISANDIIGISWGHTMYSCAQQLIKNHNVENVTVVQICGGVSNLERNIYASEIPTMFAEAYGGTPYVLPLPAIMDTVAVIESVMTDRSIKRVINLGLSANIALFTAGIFGQQNALSRAGYLSQEDLKGLEKLGAVGDICCHFINAYGEICDAEMDKRTIGISLDEIKTKEYRILVAEGSNKVNSICASLLGGYANVLITDEDTAHGVLDRANETDRINTRR